MNHRQESDPMNLEKYSLGVGDRFGRQGAAQLRALQLAKSQGVHIAPVWNKSYREHSIIGTRPEDARIAADKAVRECRWGDRYYVDADHIGMKTVDMFLPSSNFFTLDVTDFIGKPADSSSLESFVQSLKSFRGSLRIPGLLAPINVSEEDIVCVAKNYLLAMQEAGKIYRHIVQAKDPGKCVIEVSTDEASRSQTPTELFFILAAVAHEKIPIQTVAPKFGGKFLKGIDYVGSIDQFQQEFEQDLCVIAHAIRTFGLPANLKLSVHSGSDKFSLYPVIHRLIRKHDAGLHLKTAGTTWLEELIGLTRSGDKGYAIAQSVYALAYARIDELCKPYESVIEIDRSQLPKPHVVLGWSRDDFISALRHNGVDPKYNKHLRQLLHLAYKIAAELGNDYTDMLECSREDIAASVTENLFERHIKPLFLGT
ncbi:MAG: tagaturonate epimerase family protein [Bacteroidota bacterium]